MAILGSLLSTVLVAVVVERKEILRRQEILRAETAVQAALVTAQSLLCEAITKYPDSVSVWDERLPGLQTPGTALYIFERTDSGRSARVLVLPLVSGVREAREWGQNPFDSSLEFCDLNSLLPANWLGGTRQKEGRPISICAPWVRLGAQENTPLLARYAFILEDESFKLNLQEASLDSSSLLRSAKDISLKAILSQIPGVDAGTQAEELFLFRKRLGVFDDLGQIDSVLRLTPQQSDSLKFLCTIHSEALNLTRRGFPRVNVNKLFHQTSSSKEIRRQLDDFISAVQRESPHFGQRFYRSSGAPPNATSVVSKEHENIYLNKLAANIRDFLLPGVNPTRVLNAKDYPILLPDSEAYAPPRSHGVQPNPLVAIGKKRIPYLQEYVLAARLVRMEPSEKDNRTPAGAKFEMTLDHFLEFWNMSDKPIRVEDLGPGARLILRNQPPWDLDDKTSKGWGIPEPSERDLEIPLANFRSFKSEPLVFLPGRATVLTTYPNPPPASLFLQGARFFTASGFDQEKRSFSGVTYRIQDGKKTGFYEVGTKLRYAGNADHETECLLVNDQGWIDGFGYLPILTSIAIRDNNGQLENGIRWYIRSSGLMGESEGKLDQTGDPRTLNEQLALGEKNSVGGKNVAMNDLINLSRSSLPHTRFLQNAGIKNFPGKSSLGSVDSPFIELHKWLDPVFSESEPEKFTPAVFVEGPLKTIAELGHVFDPIRNSIPQIQRDRGGGRTLRIGQPEFFSLNEGRGVWDRDPLSQSREWTAWRLCDIFSVTDKLRCPGAVNINGVLRAEGAILRALLHDFRWDRSGSRELGGYGLAEEDILRIIRHFQKRIRREKPYKNRGGPFFERGEISEIDLFQGVKAFPTTFVNQSKKGLAERNDRVREEIVRYLLEVITTRGSIFSAYCIGQAVRLTASGNYHIRATRRAKFTFRLIPLDEAGRRIGESEARFKIDNQGLMVPFRYEIEMLSREN